MLKKIIASLVLIGLLVTVYMYFKWSGLALVVTGLITWVLLHFNRMMKVLRSAANRPMGFVDSAVMFNARLKPKMALLNVIKMTQALGVLQTPDDVQPEIFRWAEAGDSYVNCTFLNGKLQSWQLVRPSQTEEQVQAYDKYS
jgi:cytochrome c oxidase subunit IV